MDWRHLDLPTRAAIIATAVAVVTMIVPPVGITVALLAIILSATALYRARRTGENNRLALICLATSSILILLVVVGNAIYAAGT